MAEAWAPLLRRTSGFVARLTFHSGSTPGRRRGGGLPARTGVGVLLLSGRARLNVCSRRWPSSASRGPSCLSPSSRSDKRCRGNRRCAQYCLRSHSHWFSPGWWPKTTPAKNLRCSESAWLRAAEIGVLRLQPCAGAFPHIPRADALGDDTSNFDAPLGMVVKCRTPPETGSTVAMRCGSRRNSAAYSHELRPNPPGSSDLKAQRRNVSAAM
jgi:hypothetical protein